MSSFSWVPIITWFVAPIIGFLANKLLSYLEFNLSRKLWELKFNIIPCLERAVEDVTEQIMLRSLRAAKEKQKKKGKRPEPDLQTLGELAKNLKSKLYEAEGILDFAEYRRIEKTVISGTSICSLVLQTNGDCIGCCRRSSFGQKLQQCAQYLNQKLKYLGDKLQQCAFDLDRKIWVEQREPILPVRVVPGQSSIPATPSPTPHAPSSSNPLSANADPNSATMPSPTTPPDDAPSASNPLTPADTPLYAAGRSVSESAEEAPSNSLVQMICDWLVYGFSALNSFYLAACHLRDCSYEPVGIKYGDDTLMDWIISILGIISLRKMLNDIDYIVSESQKSPLLNHNSSSSSTPNDADKESKGNTSTVIKNSDKETSRKHKEIGDFHKTEVVGRDGVCSRICQMLRDEPAADAASSSTSDKPYSVVGIYGLPGSGKHTLAKYVYNHEKKVAGHFNPIMFIHVGKTLSMDDIFRGMLEQMTQSQPSNNSMIGGMMELIMRKKELKDKDLTSVKTELKTKLTDKRFLLILDDLWVNDENPKEWDDLLVTLNDAKCGSKILVTAQKEDAAGALGAHQQSFPIPDLEKDDYLFLFMRQAGLHAGHVDYEEYRDIGEKIVKKLHRSPIAAVTVGKQLRNKDIGFWKTIEKLDVLNETIGALWWCSQQLDAEIRRCFAYFSTFPTGYGFELDELVGIWIAHGFVKNSSNTEVELEYEGRRYIYELLNLSFLQVQRSIFGIEVFTVHDLLHELAARVAGSDCVRIDSKGCPTDIPREVQHLFVSTQTKNDRGKMLEKILDLANLRTLIIDEQCKNTAEMPIDDFGEVIERLFKNLTKLRVLIIKIGHNHALRKINKKDIAKWVKNLLLMVEQKSDRKLLSVPTCIDRMKHLRYLGFHFHDGLFDLNLPRGFSKLYHLQIIDIPCLTASCPEDMANLISLRHIYSPLSFPNIGRLKLLQTLRKFVVKEGQGYELKQLMDLNKLRGTLRIEGLGTVRSKEEVLEGHLTDKKGLERLELVFNGPSSDPDVDQAKVLRDLRPPKDLQELTIWFYKGSRYPRWTKQLHKLTLSHCRQLPSIPKDGGVFLGLRELRFDCCDWDRLPENMEHLESLRTLEILGCDQMERLRKLPRGLVKIHIGGCKLLSKTCQQAEHENWRMIKDIRVNKIW